MNSVQPTIDALALLSDRNTCAVTDRSGRIQWYCPERFDGMAVLSALIDEDRGGYWSIGLEEEQLSSRQYNGFSSVLEQVFNASGQQFTVRDWMPLGQLSSGIVREFLQPAVPIHAELFLRGNFGRQAGFTEMLDEYTVVFCNSGLVLHCSHPLTIADEDKVCFDIPAGAYGWAFLLTSGSRNQTTATIATLLDGTLAEWRKVESQFSYNGLYQQEVLQSILAIQQLTCGQTGGILAAATTSLPEVLGGERNYDYRYVWVRDAAINTIGLSMLNGEERIDVKFLEFMHKAMSHNTERCVYPLYTIDQQTILHLEKLDVSGYRLSKPVTLGNEASRQRQLDAEANILISARMLYDKYGERFHWQTMRRVANFICKHWEEPDNGIWEEGKERQYTIGKAFAAIGLEQMAPFNDDAEEAARWRKNARLIREYVRANCMTKTGAFAIYKGSEEVDVSIVLLALWGYTAPDSPEMLATVAVIEAEHEYNQLYRRILIEFDARQEGLFLAGSCWMARYYVSAGKLDKAQSVLNALVKCQNDLGFFSEEAQPDHYAMRGNFAQTFVHSSFIGAADALSKALAKMESNGL